MKKTTLLLCCLFALGGFAQQKTTGIVQLSSNTTAKLDLNSNTSTATLTLTGPSDRWFALQFGSFADGEGMLEGKDIVYWNNAIIVDCIHDGIGATPIADATNNWTTVSSTPNTPSNGLTTIVATRPFVGDATDYTFNFADNSIDFAFAKRGNTGFGFNGHGSNRGYAINKAFTTLGVEDFSLNASTVFPNPSNGNFTVKAKTNLEKINVYSQTGAFIKSIEVNNTQEVELKLSGIAAGVYLIELQNATEKSWKKILIK